MSITALLPQPQRQRLLSTTKRAQLQRVPELLGSWIAGTRRCLVCRQVLHSDAALAKHMLGIHVGAPFCNWFTTPSTIRRKRLALRLLWKYAPRSAVSSYLLERPQLLRCHKCAFTCNKPKSLRKHLKRGCKIDKRRTSPDDECANKRLTMRERMRNKMLQTALARLKRENMDIVTKNVLALGELCFLRDVLDGSTLAKVITALRVENTTCGNFSAHCVDCIGVIDSNGRLIAIHEPEPCSSKTLQVEEFTRSPVKTRSRTSKRALYKGRSSTASVTRRTTESEPVLRPYLRMSVIATRYYCRQCEALFLDYATFDSHLTRQTREHTGIKVQRHFSIAELRNDIMRFDPVDGLLLSDLNEIETQQIDEVVRRPPLPRIPLPPKLEAIKEEKMPPAPRLTPVVTIRQKTKVQSAPSKRQKRTTVQQNDGISTIANGVERPRRRSAQAVPKIYSSLMGRNRRRGGTLTNGIEDSE